MAGRIKRGTSENGVPSPKQRTPFKHVYGNEAKGDSKLETSRLEEHLDPCQIFFTNLLILGFDAERLEAETRIPFNKSMFSLPNKRGAEVVLHFLFNRLDPVLSREEFRDCWPISDKKQEQLFRSACYNWLSAIAKDSDAHLPRINASLFMSPGGSKFTNTIMHFSRYVLDKVNEKENNVKDKMDYLILTKRNCALASVLERTVECSTCLSKDKQQDILQQIFLHEEEWWSRASNNGVREVRKLSKELRELEHRIREESLKASKLTGHRISPMTKSASSSNYEASCDYSVSRRMQALQEVRCMWQKLDKCYANQQAERDVIESIVDETITKHRISSADISIKVPDLLLRECEQEIRRRHVENTFQNGKLNLVSLLQLWNLSLQMFIERYHQAGVPDFTSDVDTVSNQVHGHHSCLFGLEKLIKDVCQIKPELEKSVEVLRKQAEINEQAYLSSPALLGLLPPTPKGPLAPDEDNDSFSPNVPVFLKTPTYDSTPDAVSMIQANIAQQIKQMRQSGQQKKQISVKLFNPSKERRETQSSTVYTKLPRKSVSQTTRGSESRTAKTIDVRKHIQTSSKISHNQAVMSDTLVTSPVSNTRLTASPKSNVRPSTLHKASNKPATLLTSANRPATYGAEKDSGVIKTASLKNENSQICSFPMNMSPVEDLSPRQLSRSPSDFIVEEILGLRSPSLPTDGDQILDEDRTQPIAFTADDYGVLDNVRAQPVAFTANDDGVLDEERTQPVTLAADCVGVLNESSEPCALSADDDGISDKENIQPSPPTQASNNDVLSGMNTSSSHFSIDSLTHEDEGRSSAQFNESEVFTNLSGIETVASHNTNTHSPRIQKDTVQPESPERLSHWISNSKNSSFSSLYTSPKKIVQSLLSDNEAQKMADDVRRMFRESLDQTFSTDSNNTQRDLTTDATVRKMVNLNKEDALDTFEEPLLSFEENSEKVSPLNLSKRYQCTETKDTSGNYSKAEHDDGDAYNVIKSRSLFSEYRSQSNFQNNKLRQLQRDSERLSPLMNKLGNVEKLESSMQGVEDLLEKSVPGDGSPGILGIGTPIHGDGSPGILGIGTPIHGDGSPGILGIGTSIPGDGSPGILGIGTPIHGDDSPGILGIGTSVHGDGSPGILDLDCDLDDSFIPLKDGFQFEGGTPSKSINNYNSFSKQNSHKKDDVMLLDDDFDSFRLRTDDLEDNLKFATQSHQNDIVSDPLERYKLLRQKTEQIRKNLEEHHA